MTRSRIVLLLWVVLLIGAIGTGRDLLYNLWYLITALLLVSFLWAWTGVQWLRVERNTRTTRSQVGKIVEERLIVENRSWLPKLWLEVRDLSTLPNHQASWVINSLGARRQHTRTVQTRCAQRGRFTLGPLTLSSGDPFGLFRTTRALEEPRAAPLIVYPATVDVPAFAPLIGLLSGGETMHRRTFYVTTDVSGVRDYAPGDSFNRIHWRSSARAGRLISKEFELDPTADVWLVLDLHRDVQMIPAWADQPADYAQRLPWEISRRLELVASTVEYGVTVTASLARHFITRDRAVGFVAYCPRREIIPADRGERQLTKILETLAVVRPEGRIPLTEVIAAEGRHLSRNMTVVVITPSDEKYWISAARDLRQRGIRVIAVLIEPSSFGHFRSNESLVHELSISGIPTYLVREGDDLTRALARPYGQAIEPIGRHWSGAPVSSGGRP